MSDYRALGKIGDGIRGLRDAMDAVTRPEDATHRDALGRLASAAAKVRDRLAKRIAGREKAPRGGRGEVAR